MRTLDRSRNDDALERLLTEGLHRIASTLDARDPGEFAPDTVRLVVTGETPPPRRTSLWLAVAAVVVVAIGGLVVLAGRDVDPAPADEPPPPTADPAWAQGANFRFETPTVRLAADQVEVVTPAGTFVPTAEVDVGGDPGMPEEYTTLELTWFEDDIEQRIHIYFASDGATWWATEIRTYDGAADGEWFEPIAIDRYFETPLGEAYTGDLELPNLRISDMTLQAFVPPAACDTPTTDVALVADFPTIRGWESGGYGATFQVYDTATCQPLPVADYSFDYTIADPGVAVVEPDDGAPDVTAPPATIPGSAVVDAVVDSIPAGRVFDEIKARVGLSFHSVGTTTLHVVATDADGTVVGTVDIPIVVVEQPAVEEDTRLVLEPVVDADGQAILIADPAVDEILVGVPIPEGLDPATLALGDVDHYQAVVQLTATVVCRWLDQWFVGEEIGDQALRDEAAAALATAREWPALNDIAEQGAWHTVVWQWADAVNGGEGIASGGGPQPPSRDAANAALGCAI